MRGSPSGKLSNKRALEHLQANAKNADELHGHGFMPQVRSKKSGTNQHKNYEDRISKTHPDGRPKSQYEIDLEVDALEEAD